MRDESIISFQIFRFDSNHIFPYLFAAALQLHYSFGWREGIQFSLYSVFLLHNNRRCRGGCRLERSWLCVASQRSCLTILEYQRHLGRQWMYSCKQQTKFHCLAEQKAVVVSFYCTKAALHLEKNLSNDYFSQSRRYRF